MSAYMEPRDLPPSDVGTEYLSVDDIGPGEHHAYIHEWESRGDGKIALYLRGYRKAVLLDKNTIAAMGRDFKETNWDAWLRKGVTLSTSETEISVKAVPRHAPPVPKPSIAQDRARQLADLLALAIDDRNQTAEILRRAADLLLASH
jgi:hypothetical protein